MSTGSANPPEQPEGTTRSDGDRLRDTEPTPVPAAPVLPTPTSPTPILPTQSREDTDAGWGEYAEQGDDDRLLRDRPPHWDSP